MISWQSRPVLYLTACLLLIFQSRGFTADGIRRQQNGGEEEGLVGNSSDRRRRLLQNVQCGALGAEPGSSIVQYARYLESMTRLYQRGGESTCLPMHKACGWPRAVQHGGKRLPLFVLSVGLEGAGHHLWTELLDSPVVDCLWINGRHYQRDVGDGVPRTTVSKLASGIREQFQLRLDSGKPACKTIYDAEDSFPTGAIRKSGRVFMRPDIINIQKLDGVLFNVKYLVIIRNVTDTTLSALRRNFFTNIDTGLRTVEHTLSYLEAALRGAPCQRTMVVHYEHVLSDGEAFVKPLSSFFELEPGSPEETALRKRLVRSSGGGEMKKGLRRKEHKLTQYAECKDAGMGEKTCYDFTVALLEDFFRNRAFMWPTFAANGWDVV